MLLLLLLLQVATAQQTTKLRQVHVITRHGSRLPLPKDSSNLSELVSTQGPPLTAIGEKQLYDVGVWLKTRYPNITYTSALVRLESSDVERTIVSANSLAAGLFDEASRDPNGENLLSVLRPNVPIYTERAVNDIYIRAYDKCSSYHDALVDLYENNPDWQQVETRHASLLQKLALNPLFKKFAVNGTIPLEDLWNVFDVIFVAKTECQQNTTTAACPDPADQYVVSEDEWQDLQIAAHAAEFFKYSPEVAKTMIGSNLLQKIASRMREAVMSLQVVDSEAPPQFYLYSAHYPTILGFFAALNIVLVEQEVIPGYGAAVVIEVYEPVAGSEPIIQWYYKESESKQADLLPKSCDHGPSCPLGQEFQKFVTEHTIEAWCRECDNDTADVCVNMLWKSELETEGAISSCDDYILRNPGLAGALCGLVGGAVLAVLIGWFCRRRRAQKSKNQSDEAAALPTDMKAPSNAAGELDNESLGSRDLVV